MNSLPRNFLFGSATAAHQVEGGNHNDWTEWEQTAAARLAHETHRDSTYGQAPSPVWHAIKAEAQSPDNYISGDAAGHYSRYERDIAAAQKLGLNAYRFSVEWSRVQPEKGIFDDAAIAHYVDVAKACRAHGQEPFVTLWHFTLPVWAAAEGGWLSASVVAHFGEYARRIGEALQPHVKFYATLNEPEVHANMGYLFGIWPPALQNPGAFLRVRRALVKAHLAAYTALKQVNPDNQVGFCSSQSWVETERSVLQPAVALANRHANHYFTDRLAAKCDWLGMQYYMKISLHADPQKKLSDMGWRLHPEGHTAVLQRLARYGKPIYITESGLADATDKYRAWYIEESLKSVAEAVAAGVDCRGYFYWSLLDNFEWHEGFWPKFGLLEVDRKTLERRPRQSAAKYAELIHTYTASPTSEQ